MRFMRFLRFVVHAVAKLLVFTITISFLLIKFTLNILILIFTLGAVASYTQKY